MPLEIGRGRHPTTHEVSRCTQYPLVSQSSPSTFNVGRAHSLLVATENEAVCFDILLSTYIGLRLRISMELEYSSEIACENPSTKDLVAEQLDTQGTFTSAENEDTLMIADLLSLLSMWGIMQLDISTHGTQLTTISSRRRWSAISCRYPMLEIPTLLTRMEVCSTIPLFSSASNIFAKKRYCVLLVKSATTQSVLILLSQLVLIFLRACIIFSQLRAIMQMLNPRAASSSQKPRPMPSLPPVMTAQVLSPQRSRQFFSGRIILTTLQRNLARKTARKRAPTTARKYTKLRVDCSILNRAGQNYKLSSKMAEGLDSFVDELLDLGLQLVADGDLLLHGQHPAQLVDAAPLHRLPHLLGVLVRDHLDQRQREQLVASQPFQGLLVVDALVAQEIVKLLTMAENIHDYFFDFLFAFGTGGSCN